ncbi:hypothetical protein [Microbacterium sp. Marseille-Q6965]|uniref:hypothetical protein n=1 Tax=Microbacterium sp. Marseille-Q6965 TaxID=2965072 RepID=UPI0021B7328E|nr:hypothetical protein [Microbacterium sp. Marseille-Q6965]
MTHPGGGGSSNSDGGTTQPISGDGGGGDSGEPEPRPERDPRWGPCRDDQTSPRADGLCWQEYAPDEQPPAAEGEAPVIPPVQASDVARFAPATPAVGTEPDGVAVVGMPMNVIVRSGEHSATGSLFDLPMSVHFTPVEIRIDYGDGTTKTVPPNGGTWDELGQPEFTPTPTSHAYAARGHYQITATVMLAAVVDFGPWGTRPVTGLVASPAAARTVQAVTADTGLVQQTCLENPAGPGC